MQGVYFWQTAWRSGTDGAGRPEAAARILAGLRLTRCGWLATRTVLVRRSRELGKVSSAFSICFLIHSFTHSFIFKDSTKFRARV